MESLGSDKSVTKSVDPVPPPSLQDRIQTLTDVHNRLQTLRHVPTMLLRPPSTSPLADFPPPFDPTIDLTFKSTPAHDFRALKEFVEVVCSDKVQEALGAARASEDGDGSELGSSFRRENWKRKGPQSPVGSPLPYVPSPPSSSSLFASAEDDPPLTRAESLVEFVREFNRGNESSVADGAFPKCKLAIWSRTKTMRDELKAGWPDDGKGGSWQRRGTRLTSPVVLRFTISDVLTAYISLIFTKMEDGVVVESVAAFGPRERKLPHEQSDYLAFRGLSQHVARMILSRPRVPVRALMRVLVSYRGLFVERCTGCQRVLSADGGHVPPVARVWVPKESRFEPRHATCLYD